MFIVYSPEGQKAIAASNLKLNYMKVAKSKPDIPLGESGLEKENIKVKSEIPAQNSEAIKCQVSPRCTIPLRAVT